jgi:integrase/recombinase XerD
LTLTGSWERSLKAERKSPDTIRSYLTGVEVFARWCTAEGCPIALDEITVRDWTNSMLDSGFTAATCIARQRGVRRFSVWLAAKGIIERDLIDRVRPPKLDEPLVPALTDGQLRALLGTCRSTSFHDVCDRALI